MKRTLDNNKEDWPSCLALPRKGIERILIYRLGSIGDFVVALPCLHLVRSRFPAARIALLTNKPVEARAAPAISVLEGSDLVHECLAYPLRSRDYHEIRALRQSVLAFAPDLLVYLASRSALPQVLRDYVFFKWCGVRRMVGFPFTADMRHSRPPVIEGGPWEAEAGRLARCISPLGDAVSGRAESWSLRLSQRELALADQMIAEELSGASEGIRILGLSIGTKQATNDWGAENWRAVLGELSDPNLALMLVGAGEERELSRAVARAWAGPFLDFCGRAAPRISAALIRRTELFLCHDSGPMHLAASVGTRCVAVFSRLNRPGEWFPFGTGHKILYPATHNSTIQSISPSVVVAAAREILADSAHDKLKRTRMALEGNGI